jgi:hypothetical protein
MGLSGEVPIKDVEDLCKELPSDVTIFPKKTLKKKPKEIFFSTCVLMHRQMKSKNATNSNSSKFSPYVDADADVDSIKFLFVRRPQNEFRYYQCSSD